MCFCTLSCSKFICVYTFIRSRQQQLLSFSQSLLGAFVFLQKLGSHWST